MGSSSACGQSRLHTIVVDGQARSYILYSPSLPGGGKVPLMLVLHGGTGNANHMEKIAGMDAVADAGHFIVAYPNGTGGRFSFNRNRRVWNAGSCCGRAVRQQVDDVRFIKEVISKIAGRYPIDRRRVYVAGISNGAMMAYRLACEIPDEIAAVVSVAGTLAVDNCDAARGIPVLHIHGERDQNVPFNGGEGTHSKSGVRHRSVPETMRLLTRSRSCSPPVERTVRGRARETKYRCSDGAPVELYLVLGEGHGWPEKIVSPDGGDVSTSRFIWEFVSRFSKPVGKP